MSAADMYDKHGGLLANHVLVNYERFVALLPFMSVVHTAMVLYVRDNLY